MTTTSGEGRGRGSASLDNRGAYIPRSLVVGFVHGNGCRFPAIKKTADLGVKHYYSLRLAAGIHSKICLERVASRNEFCCMSVTDRPNAAEQT